MKLGFLLLVALVIAGLVFFFKKKNSLRLSLMVFMGLVILIFIGFVASNFQADTQCSTKKQTYLVSPAKHTTADDFMARGDFAYDIGDCKQAIIDYSQAIALKPTLDKAYNNRAYVYMRLRDFPAALSDLNKALNINPHYVQALMNRGDIHNYYYQIDRSAAVADYEQVIELSKLGKQYPNVCGHLFLAKHNGWNLTTLGDMVMGKFRDCD